MDVRDRIHGALWIGYCMEHVRSTYENTCDVQAGIQTSIHFDEMKKKEKDLQKEIAQTAQLKSLFEADAEVAAEFAREYIDLALASSVWEMQATYGIYVEITAEVVLEQFGVSISSEALSRAKEVHAEKSRGKYKPRRLERAKE